LRLDICNWRPFYILMLQDPKTGKPFPDAMIKGNIAILLVGMLAFVLLLGAT